MSDSTTSLPDRYNTLIEKIVEKTLKGKIRSKEQVYRSIVKEVAQGTGEIFERCLDDRLRMAQHQVDTGADELKKAKANRILKALKTIEQSWERWQQENQAKRSRGLLVDRVLSAEPDRQLFALLRSLDPNQPQALNIEQLQEVAKTLAAAAKEYPDREKSIAELAAGIEGGLESWQRLEPYLTTWMYDQGRSQIGFEGVPGQRGPWMLWAKQTNAAFAQALFEAIALNQSIAELAAKRGNLEPGGLVELALILQFLQRGLVAWFDKLVYNAKASTKLSSSTFLTFAVIWSGLANGFNQAQSKQLADGCFQITLQILRAFAQQKYFPLYGGIFASFTGEYLREALDYLDEPLSRLEGTQEKARILTMLGYSLRARGEYARSLTFHEQALEIALEAGDRSCAIANLNHLSRTSVARKNYSQAISYSQRALILSRESGDTRGQANALANLGYSEVFQAREGERLEPEVYERAMDYLQQGLQLSEKLSDRQSQALCSSSLGIACIVLDKPQEALQYLAQGLEAAQFAGDFYLQGINYAYIAQAYYSVSIIQKAVATGCLGMYILEQIGSSEWRQPAGLLTILQGQWGTDAFNIALEQQRKDIISVIGVDGYDYIRELLEKYKRSL